MPSPGAGSTRRGAGVCESPSARADDTQLIMVDEASYPRGKCQPSRGLEKDIAEQRLHGDGLEPTLGQKARAAERGEIDNAY